MEGGGGRKVTAVKEMAESVPAHLGPGVAGGPPLFSGCTLELLEKLA